MRSNGGVTVALLVAVAGTHLFGLVSDARQRAQYFCGLVSFFCGFARYEPGSCVELRFSRAFLVTTYNHNQAAKTMVDMKCTHWPQGGFVPVVRMHATFT